MKIAKEVEKNKATTETRKKNHKSMAAAFLLFIFQWSTIRVSLDETHYESSHLTFRKGKRVDNRNKKKIIHKRMAVATKKKSSFHIRSMQLYLNETDYEIYRLTFAIDLRQGAPPCKRKDNSVAQNN